MAEVKFVNIAKYKGTFYPAHTPFVVDDQDVESLIQQGAIVTIPPHPIVPEGDKKSIEEMTVAELVAYAEEHSIDLGRASKKADILAAIEAATNSNQ